MHRVKLTFLDRQELSHNRGKAIEIVAMDALLLLKQWRLI